MITASVRRYKVPKSMTPMGFEKLMKVYKCTFEELVQAQKEAGAVED